MVVVEARPRWRLTVLVEDVDGVGSVVGRVLQWSSQVKPSTTLVVVGGRW